MNEPNETLAETATTIRPPEQDAEEAKVLQMVLAGLTSLPKASRGRILNTVAVFLGINHGPSREMPVETRPVERRPGTPYSERGDMPPKQFMLEKQPRSDVERVACLGYYLTHFRDTPHFKTIDISALNTDAAQPKFANTAAAVNNAALQGYLVQATKGNKQLSAAGEQFVLALPDRDAARAALERGRPRRTSRKKSGASD